ncbi:MAG: hypothetical protein IT431_15525 [Phycisphaerales bacterium]|nr:hypothetical protein [Phycisphaerales bacterium]
MTLAVVTALAVLAVMMATYLMFRVVGTRRHSLLLTAEEKARWDATVVPKIGKPLVVASLVGTLTSLATAYLFFIGTSKVFGYWILVCPISIFTGGFVTNWITKRVLANSSLRTRITGSTQQSGVIARLFWSREPAGVRVARIVKWISVLSMTGVIWLEFALFGDVLGLLLGIQSIPLRAAICALATIVVTDFTLRFGLRGFIFADAFHSPLLVAAAIVLVVATVVQFLSGSGQSFDSHTLQTLVAPIVDSTSGMLFVAHVLVLNAFLVVFTEAHWLRLWVLTDRPVISRQLLGTAFTASIWLILSICGLIAFSMTQEIGEGAVVALLKVFAESGILVVTVFWLGAAAALFSTADTQIYGLLLVSQFNPGTGVVSDRPFSSMRPLSYALVAGALFFAAYWIVRASPVPFEKIIFIIIPFTLNLMPAFFALLIGRVPSATLLLLTLTGYSVCAGIGFAQPTNQFTMTLLASLVPVAVSPFVLVTRRSESSDVNS